MATKEVKEPVCNEDACEVPAMDYKAEYEALKQHNEALTKDYNKLVKAFNKLLQEYNQLHVEVLLKDE